MPTKPPTTACRLLLDPPGGGAWNMAVDEVLLERSVEEDLCCWRMYRWREPTLSLGYFQSHGDRRDHAHSINCPTVRRLTGGGAIVHDIELTYSLVVPAGHPLAAQRNRLYETVHNSLIETLTEFGVSATLCKNCQQRRAVTEPFLCFQRRSPGDVLIGGIKIAGSAQRRRRGTVLQHGSILLGRSAAAPELDGLAEIAQKSITAEVLTEAWTAVLAEDLSFAWHEEPLSEHERRLATELEQQKYASVG